MPVLIYWNSSRVPTRWMQINGPPLSSSICNEPLSASVSVVGWPEPL